MIKITKEEFSEMSLDEKELVIEKLIRMGLLDRKKAYTMVIEDDPENPYPVSPDPTNVEAYSRYASEIERRRIEAQNEKTNED